MTVRVSTVLIWVVAVLALALGGFGALHAMQGGPGVAPSDITGLGARIDQLSATIDGLKASADGATPVVNAAKLNGLTADQFVQRRDAGPGYANCLGIGMWPWSSETKYTQTKAGREVTSGEGFFDCFVSLPDGATITALRALVHDTSATQQAVCYMVAGRRLSTEKGYTVAYTNESGDTATPGDTIIEDTTIEGGPVDNATYSYIVECWLSGPGDLALRGVSVEYTVAGG